MYPFRNILCFQLAVLYYILYFSARISPHFKNSKGFLRIAFPSRPAAAERRQASRFPRKANAGGKSPPALRPCVVRMAHRVLADERPGQAGSAVLPHPGLYFRIIPFFSGRAVISAARPRRPSRACGPGRSAHGWSSRDWPPPRRGRSARPGSPRAPPRTAGRGCAC